jgi:transcriptional regulator with XRE-family HTH domain
VDWVRFGRLLRALRMDRGLTQLQLAGRARISQTLVSRIERGGGGSVRSRTLQGIGEVLGARVTVRLDWNGEALDRLTDAGHADLVEQVVAALAAHAWEVVPEATFLIRGERGSIDVLAWHAASATLLIVEVKSVVPDIQGLLAPLDRKTRLAADIALPRGWRARRVDVLLVIGDTRTSRRRVERYGVTFVSRFPDRIARIRQVIANPATSGAPLRGLWFLSFNSGATARHRVRRARPRSTRDPRPAAA